MHRPIRHVLPVLVLALLGGCALPRTAAGPVAGSAPASSAVSTSASTSIFAGIDDVDVLVATDLPDAYAAPHGLRSLSVRDRIRARLVAAGIPLRPDSVAFDHTRPSLMLDISALSIGPDEFAVWSRVTLSETVRLRRRELPRMVSTWASRGKVVIRGDDTAPLWREVDRLTDQFIAEFRAANRTPGTEPV